MITLTFPLMKGSWPTILQQIWFPPFPFYMKALVTSWTPSVIKSIHVGGLAACVYLGQAQTGLYDVTRLGSTANTGMLVPAKY